MWPFEAVGYFRTVLYSFSGTENGAVDCTPYHGGDVFAACSCRCRPAVAAARHNRIVQSEDGAVLCLKMFGGMYLTFVGTCEHQVEELA